MSLTLRIRFPEGLATESLLEQERIPCLSRIDDTFEILFEAPLPEAQGTVEGWDAEKVVQRVPLAVGGAHFYHAFSTITLAPLEPDVFKIMQLAFFNRTVGWCPILEHGEYVPVVNTAEKHS